MNTNMLFIGAAFALAIALFAHTQLARFTAGHAAALLTRIVLIAVGAAFGYIAAIYSAGDPVRPALLFLIGFGAVHFPAAFILWVKRERGEGKT